MACTAAKECVDEFERLKKGHTFKTGWSKSL